MKLVRRSGVCAFCTIRSSTWLLPPLLRWEGRNFHQTVNNQRAPQKGKRPRSGHDRYVDTTPLRLGPPQFLPNGVSHGGPMKRPSITYEEFGRLVGYQINIMRDDISSRGALRSIGASHQELGIENVRDVLRHLDAFAEMAHRASMRAIKTGVTDKDLNRLYWQLKNAFIEDKTLGLKEELIHAFKTFAISRSFSPGDLANQKKIADLRYPTEWYPATRAMQREIHLHVGPTNSGKTYHALQRLEAAETGIYAGPLRLLAHEVYTRFNAKGKTCSLITGEERRIPEGVKDNIKSCTVEMVPLNTPVDVAVIDEIQMIGDLERGWAWTSAFLGVQAKEVHLCGELRSIQLIEDLSAMMGDKLFIHRYERLGKLEVAKKHVHSVKQLQKGDAVVLFSRVKIHAMKKQIEEDHPGKKCAIVYGSLPPEIRAQQAALFNDPDNEYDFLAASNAIGMGLNLSVKRIIFFSTSKYDGKSLKLLETSDIKQIGGRAGRFKTAAQVVQQGPLDLTDGPLDATHTEEAQPSQPPVGYVTAFVPNDLRIIRQNMERDAPDMKTAGLFPPGYVIERFYEQFPKTTPLSFILKRLDELIALSSHFHLCAIKDSLRTADMIQNLDLTIRDRLIFLAAPINFAGYDPSLKENSVPYLLARCIANNSSGHLLDITAMRLDIIGREPSVELLNVVGMSTKKAKKKYEEKYNEAVKTQLYMLELLHKDIGLYLWLSYRFPGLFVSQALAFHVKGLVEADIEKMLNQIKFSEETMRLEVERQKKHRLLEEQEDLAAQSGEADSIVDEEETEEGQEDRLTDEGELKNC